MKRRIRYCQRCVYPEVAVNVVFDDEGICSGCRVAEEFNKLTPEFWTGRRAKFEEILETHRSKDQQNYDCIIPVSGGKDSYWQAHLIKKVYGLNPLLVTYHGNNYLPEGQANLDRMRAALGVDHLVFGPGVETLRKLNRLCFERMGDMNWHAHAGIKIVPIIAAVRYQIPLVIWGEATWSLAGMFSPDDFVEYNKRTVMEHDLRGYSWKQMLGGSEGLEARDLLWLRFPSDEELERVKVRGIYIGNFFKWDPNQHARQMHEEHGFEFARQPFERTYRTMSNLDDMHENGIHDYMKFIKFGYGRCSDHASKDIRDGYISRAEGIERVRRYDAVKPRRDLQRWLEYVGRTEAEFDAIADRFRDPRVWRKEHGHWVKDNLWDDTGEPVRDQSTEACAA
jgi:N-acetyl sugar amidotransferase